MVEGRRGAALESDPLGVTRVDDAGRGAAGDLQGDLPAEQGVAGPEDLALSAAAERAEQVVGADASGWPVRPGRPGPELPPGGGLLEGARGAESWAVRS